MDFVRLLRSLEEFLFEVVTWFVLYPMTLWRVVRRPSSMIEYAGTEMGEPFEEQFTDLLSPLLFLLTSVVLAHGIELAFHAPMLPSTSALARQILSSDENLLLLRAILFGTFPLAMAVGMLVSSKVSVDRNTLRRPYFLQAYFVAPYAVCVSIGSVFLRLPWSGAHAAGYAIVATVTVWYVGVVAMSFRAVCQLGWIRAVGVAVGLFVANLMVCTALASAIL